MTPGTVRIAIGLLVAVGGIAAIFQDVPHPIRLVGAAAAIAGVALFSWGVVSRHRHKRLYLQP
jgi:drug/metabolite transporter (DMT)-like permease